MRRHPPELLDWLAVKFWIAAGRQDHRLIVNSSTYRQSSKMRRRCRHDGYNRLLKRARGCVSR